MMRFIRFRRASALMLTFFLIVSLFGAGNVASAKNDKNAGKQNTTEEQNYVLYSENITVNGKRYAKPANAISNETILNNLLGTLGLDTKKEANLIFNGNDYALTEATYVDGKVALNGKRVHITKSLVAKGDIIINASDVTIADGAMILSTEGKVAINCSNLTAGGPICVKQSIFIAGSKVVANDAFIGEKIEICSGTYRTDGTISTKILTDTNGSLGNVSLYTEDDVNYLYVSSSAPFCEF